MRTNAIRRILRRAVQRARVGEIVRRTSSWRKMMKSREQWRSMVIARELSLTPLDIPDSAFAGLLPKAYRQFGELACRQILIGGFLFTGLLATLNRSLSDPTLSVVIGGPPAWRRVLRKDGIRLAGIRSWLAWRGKQLQHFRAGIVAVVSLLLKAWKSDATSKSDIVVVGFPLRSVSRSTQPSAASYQFGTWFKDSPLCADRNARLRILSSEVGNEQLVDHGIVVRQELPSLSGPLQVVSFLARSAGIVAVAAARSLAGQWWASIVLRDAIVLAYARCLGERNLPAVFVFSNSNWIHRPLWSYAAEDAGRQVVMVFYSSHNDVISEKNVPPDAKALGYELMNWPEYGVWSSHHREYLSGLALGTSAKYHVLGPVPFVDNNTILPDIPPATIAVFDVSPVRRSWLSALGYPDTYYSPDNVEAFLLDSYRAIRQAGMKMIIKQKRDLRRKADYRYARCVRHLAKMDGVIVVDPGVSPFRLVDKVDGVVSLVYTSAALIAEDMGVPSVFYDPTGSQPRVSRQSHGIEVLGSRENLNEWIGAIAARRGVQPPTGSSLMARSM